MHLNERGDVSEDMEVWFLTLPPAFRSVSIFSFGNLSQLLCEIEIGKRARLLKSMYQYRIADAEGIDYFGNRCSLCHSPDPIVRMIRSS